MNKILSLAAVGAAVFLAGCGGGSSSSSSSTASFADQANAICAKYGAQINALPAPGNTAASVAASLDAELPIIQAELAEIKKLTPPSGQEALWASTLSDLEQSVAILPQASAALKAGDTAQAQALVAKAKPLSDAATASANKLGLTQCAANYQPGGTSTESTSS